MGTHGVLALVALVGVLLVGGIGLSLLIVTKRRGPSR